MKKRILLVEDEPAIGVLCQSVLAGEGFEADIAPNGRKAQELIEEGEYCLCLIDIMMPKMSGQELYEWLERKHPRMAGLVVFTTGSVIDEEIMAVISETGRPFLPKPFLPDQLREMVKEAMHQTGEA